MKRIGFAMFAAMIAGLGLMAQDPYPVVKLPQIKDVH